MFQIALLDCTSILYVSIATSTSTQIFLKRHFMLHAHDNASHQGDARWISPPVSFIIVDIGYLSSKVRSEDMAIV